MMYPYDIKHFQIKEENIMATDKSFSAASWAEYNNKRANSIDKKNTAYREGVTTFLEKTIKDLGYPNKDEAHDVIHSYKNYDVSPIVENIPETISGYMHDEGRTFNLPAADAKSAACKIGVRSVDKKVKEGIIQFGENKGKPYKTEIAPHSEYFVKNFAKCFKK